MSEACFCIVCRMWRNGKWYLRLRNIRISALLDSHSLLLVLSTSVIYLFIYQPRNLRNKIFPLSLPFFTI